MKKIALRGKRGIGKFALVDDIDFEELSSYKWHLDSWGYPRTPNRNNPERKMIMMRMHRMVLKPEKKVITDHVNGDTLDNRRSNLRIVTDQQSAFNKGLEIRNKSGYKGVCWSKQRNKWQAKIEVNDKKIYLGFFIDKIDAAKAYNEGATKYFGEFARLNDTNLDINLILSFV